MDEGTFSSMSNSFTHHRWTLSRLVMYTNIFTIVSLLWWGRQILDRTIIKLHRMWRLCLLTWRLGLDVLCCFDIDDCRVIHTRNRKEKANIVYFYCWFNIVINRCCLFGLDYSPSDPSIVSYHPIELHEPASVNEHREGLTSTDLLRQLNSKVSAEKLVFYFHSLRWILLSNQNHFLKNV
jgi:hypothetical protein